MAAFIVSIFVVIIVGAAGAFAYISCTFPPTAAELVRDSRKIGWRTLTHKIANYRSVTCNANPLRPKLGFERSTSAGAGSECVETSSPIFR